MTTPIDPSGAVILSADFDTKPKLLSTLRAFPQIKRVKIDRLGREKFGTSIVHELTDLGKEVFHDGKIIEIPSKVKGLAELYCAEKPWMLNCMAGVCSSGVYLTNHPDVRDGLKRFADVCHRHDVLPCGVTVLTAKQPDHVQLEFNGRTAGEQVLVYMDMLNQAGFTDAVCSPLEVPLIRAESQFDHMHLNTPGVRLPGQSADDQARIATPAAVIGDGAQRVVMGRGLFRGDIQANWRAVCTDLQTV